MFKSKKSEKQDPEAKLNKKDKKHKEKPAVAKNILSFQDEDDE